MMQRAGTEQDMRQSRETTVDSGCGAPRARRRRRAAALAVMLAAWLPAAVLAERADRDKEANVTADHSTLDDLHQVQVLTGHVVLIKGTMRMTGERMEHRQDEQGYQYYVCLLYTSDAADDLLCVDLGGRRIIKKKK